MQRHHAQLLAGLTLIFGTLFFVPFALPAARPGWYLLNGVGAGLVVRWFIWHGFRGRR